MRRPAALLVALALALVVAPEASAAGWLPPVYVSGSGTGPMNVAVDRAGNTFMTWVGPGGQLAVAKRPVGGNFETPQIIPVQAFEPQVGADAVGNAVVVWRSSAGGGSVQQARRAATATQFTLGPAVDTSTGSPTNGPRLDVNPGGQAVVGWTRAGGNEARWALASTTSNFGTGVAALTAAEPTKPVDVDINQAGDAAFGFTANTGGEVWAAYHARGTPLAAGSQFIASDLPSDGPQVALDEQGRALAVWDAGNDAIESSFHPIGAAGQWTTPGTTLDSGLGGPFKSADVGFDENGRGVATWVAGTSVRTKTRPVGDPPAQFPSGTATVFSNETASDTSLGWAIPGKIALLIKRASDSQMRASSWLPGTTFGPIVAVSEPGHQGAEHDIAVSGGGNVVAAWVDTAPFSGPTTMASAVYDAVPPQFGAQTNVPEKAFVGDEVAMSGTPLDDWTKTPSVIWTFSDGVTRSGISISRAFNKTGSYSVTVLAEDSVGNATSLKFPIEVVEKPTRGVDFNASKVSGTVFVSVPSNAPAGRVLARPAVAQAAAAIKPPKGYRRFRRLGADDNIPVGSILDSTKGVSEITLATNRSGTKRQTGRFSQGVFRTQQSKGNPLTTAVLMGPGDFRRQCRPFGFRFAKTQADAARKRKRPRRRLFSRVKGRFRTRGRHSTATVRGTEFIVRDECKGTTTRVIKGSVTVRDLVKKRTRIVKAPRSYLARTRR